MQLLNHFPSHLSDFLSNNIFGPYNQVRYYIFITNEDKEKSKKHSKHLGFYLQKQAFDNNDGVQ